MYRTIPEQKTTKGNGRENLNIATENEIALKTEKRVTEKKKKKS